MLNDRPDLGKGDQAVPQCVKEKLLAVEYAVAPHRLGQVVVNGRRGKRENSSSLPFRLPGGGECDAVDLAVG